MGPPVKGQIMALKSSPVEGRPHGVVLSGGSHCSIVVAGQLLERRPMGTCPPKLWWRCLPKNQQTAEKLAIKTPPGVGTVTGLPHVWKTVRKSRRGTFELVAVPTVNRRMSERPFASFMYVAACSLAESANHILLWPPQMKTSPKRTSFSMAVSPVAALMLMVYGPPAGVGGKLARQMPSAPVTEWSRVPLKAVWMWVPARAKPHTVAEAGARCRTMWLPSERCTLKLATGPSGGAAKLLVAQSLTETPADVFVCLAARPPRSPAKPSSNKPPRNHGLPAAVGVGTMPA
mmetsp:Transcript_137107/g.426035  ORF Transcript_137107/g.426035 Transcript_137107/m.426035 type:complete len:289 (-) Transcript_137107:50-916(-)